MLDEHTVEFRLSEAFAPFLSNLAYPTGLIVSPAAVENMQGIWPQPVGDRPFKFVEWLSNQRVVVQRNPDYWDGARSFRPWSSAPSPTPTPVSPEMMAGGNRRDGGGAADISLPLSRMPISPWPSRRGRMSGSSILNTRRGLLRIARAPGGQLCG